VVHGDGLTSLQFRAETGGPTREIQCDRQEPTAIRLEKRGDYFQLFTSNEDGVYSATGCMIKVSLGTKFLAGLAVCAHDNKAFETARFSSVTVGLPPERKSVSVSAIEIVPVASLDRRVVWYSSEKIEVPSFTAGGDAICFREGGQIKKLSLIGHSEPLLVGAENMDACATGAPLMSAAERLSSRVERGRSLVWLEPAGGKPRKLIDDDRNQWQPRIAPDAASFVYLSGSGKPVDGKPPLGDYLLAQRPLAGGEARVLAHFYGGPGSLGLSPWSPDGKSVVFMSREPAPVEK
jgi:TolB protein